MALSKHVLIVRGSFTLHVYLALNYFSDSNHNFKSILGIRTLKLFLATREKHKIIY